MLRRSKQPLVRQQTLLVWAVFQGRNGANWAGPAGLAHPVAAGQGLGLLLKQPTLDQAERNLVASNLNLKPGECLRVRGEIAPDAKSFALNLGKDDNNMCLHFNPRFNIHGDINTIVCISFDQTDLTIQLPDGYSFKRQLPLPPEPASFVCV
ncbi:Galectin-1 [Myotis davidii]|uniref:Galectin n=1 Tax=Myotis davidii TaxID=225400 RepID=L5M9M4_MYODS|nr:Galectin-1 [Myotis davidii]